MTEYNSSNDGFAEGPADGQQTDAEGTSVTQDPDTSTDTSQPTAYDREQDAQSAQKDAEIAQLREQLAAFQQSAPDQVAGNVTPVSTPSTPSNDEAQFHPVEPGGVSSSDAGVGFSGGEGTVGSIPIPDETPAVDFAPAPELDGTPAPSEQVHNTEELREAVTEILVKVREIHETVAWVKSEAPKFAQALGDSPFGKLMPTLLKNI